MELQSFTAIACSGLGWVRRGNETWAQGTAEALHRRAVNVTLFGGGPLACSCGYRRIPTLRRDHAAWRGLVDWGRRYALEQSLFAALLSWRLGRGRHDIVHTGDPQVAWGLDRRRQRHDATVVYKDGLLLGPGWCAHFDWVQVLAPHYLDAGSGAGLDTSNWRVIPHFIDPERFQSPKSKIQLRQELLGAALPSNAKLVLAAGALAARSNKRLDWIVREVAAVPDVHLLVVGQAEPEDVRAFESLARPLLRARLHLRTNLPPEQMPGYFLAADVFAHAALKEPFGIVLIEALAAGLPVLGHSFPVTRWIIGDGGASLNMEAAGELSAFVRNLLATPRQLQALHNAARERARREFSPDAILPRYEAMYADIRRWRKGGADQP